MPKVLEDRRQAIARNNPNLSKSSTYAIATSALQKEGKMPRRYAQGGMVKAGAPAVSAPCRDTKVISCKGG